MSPNLSPTGLAYTLEEQDEELHRISCPYRKTRDRLDARAIYLSAFNRTWRKFDRAERAFIDARRCYSNLQRATERLLIDNIKRKVVGLSDCSGIHVTMRGFPRG